MSASGAIRSSLSELVPGRGPARRLATATFVNTVGQGIFLAGGAIFLTRSAGLPVAQVGLGLTLAGLASLLAGIVIGDVADRRGAREIYVLTLLLEGVAMAGFAFTRSFWLFLLAAAVSEIGHAGSSSSRGALVALIGGADGRVRLRAQLRSVTNVGVSIGALIAGAALALDTRGGYVAMILGDAASFWLAASILLTLPSFPPTRAAGAEDNQHRWLAVGDRPFLAVTAVNAVLAVNYTVLTVALPLWVAGHTDAPRWVVAPLFLVNTVAVTVLQVRASRGVETPAVAARALRRSGVVFAAAWLLIGLSGGTPRGLALALLVGAVAIHTAGELWQAAGSFELSFSLARPDALGQYQGVFGVGEALASTAGPLLVTGVLLAGGLAGWVGLGLLLAAAGALAPVTTAHAVRRRAALVP